MATGGEDQLSSFLVVRSNCDYCDLDQTENQLKAYLENVQKSGGGKITVDGLRRNPNSKTAEYVVHFANKKSVERILQRHEHILEVDGKHHVLTMERCPESLRTVIKELPHSPGGGSDKGGGGDSSKMSSNSSSNEELCEKVSSSESSDIEVLGRECSSQEEYSLKESDGFTVVNKTKDKAIEKIAETVSTTADLSKDHFKPDTVKNDDEEDTGSSGSGESFDSAGLSTFDEWSRSVVLENVPRDLEPIVQLLICNKERGGGDVVTFVRNEETNKTLATFEDSQVAQNLLKMGKIKVNDQVIKVTRPLLVEKPDEERENREEKGAKKLLKEKENEVINEELKNVEDGNKDEERDSEKDTEAKELSDVERKKEEDDSENKRKNDNENKKINEEREEAMNEELKKKIEDEQKVERDILDTRQSSEEKDKEDNVTDKFEVKKEEDEKEEEESVSQNQDAENTRNVYEKEDVMKIDDKIPNDDKPREVSVDDIENEEATGKEEKVTEDEMHLHENKDAEKSVNKNDDQQQADENKKENSDEKDKEKDDENEKMEVSKVVVETKIDINDEEDKNEEEYEKIYMKNDDVAVDFKSAEIKMEAAATTSIKHDLTLETVTSTAAVNEESDDSDYHDVAEETETNDPHELYKAGAKEDPVDLSHNLSNDDDDDKVEVKVDKDSDSLKRPIAAKRKLLSPPVTEEKTMAVEKDVKDYFKAPDTTESRSIMVTNVTDEEMLEVVEAFVINTKKGGGPTEFINFNENEGIATIAFIDKKVAEHFLSQRSFRVMGTIFKILPFKKMEEDENQELLSRTVEVQRVESEDDVDVITLMMENMKKGGGPIELHHLDESRRVLTVRFQEKKVADQFVATGFVKAARHKWQVTAFGKSVVDEWLTSIDGSFSEVDSLSEIPFEDSDKNLSSDAGHHSKKDSVDMSHLSTTADTIDEDYSDDGDKNPSSDAEHHLKKDSVDMSHKTVADKIDEDSSDDGDSVDHKRKHPIPEIFRKENSVEYNKPSVEEEEKKEPIISGVIEVEGSFKDKSLLTIQMIFEGKKYTGLENTDVTGIRLLKEEGRAIITFSDPSVAEKLIAKGSINFKGQIYTISLPSRRGADSPTSEEEKPEKSVISISNLPLVIDKDMLSQLFENKRFTGMDSIIVTDVQFVEDGRALVTISNPKIAAALIDKGRISYKKRDYIISDPSEFNTKPVIKDDDDLKSPESTDIGSSEDDSVDCHKVLIAGIPSSFTQEKLKKLFESTTSGGGKINNICFEKGSGTAVITFKDLKIAEALVYKEIVEVGGNKFVITRYTREELGSEPRKKDILRETHQSNEEEPMVSNRTINVSNIPLDMSNDTLTMVFESKRYFGGDIDNVIYEQGQGRALITFQDPKVAESLISKTFVEWKKCRLLVAICSDDEDKNKFCDRSSQDEETNRQEQPSTVNRTIDVKNISKDISKETLVMFFESKRYGGGEITDVIYENEEGTAVISFKDPEVAASLIAKEVVEFKKQKMFITKHEEVVLSSRNVAPKKPMVFSSDANFNTVKIKRIPRNASKDMLSMYFENKTRSGGGNLQLLQHDLEKGKAVIKFDDFSAALSVYNKSHSLMGTNLELSPLEPPLDDVQSCAIEVKSISNDATTDLLQLYFEHTKRSGGGPVEEIKLDQSKNIAIVIFEDSQSVFGVMQQTTHVLNTVTMNISILEPLPPPPLLLDDIDTKRLLAKHLPSNTTKDSLKKYIVRAANANMVGLTQGIKPSTALLDFSLEPDYLALRRLVISKPFMGKMISIQRVPHTCSILVSGIPAKVSEEFIAMYFENSKNGGNGDECKVEMMSDKCCAVVTFTTSAVIGNIVSKKHELEKTVIDVKPYYPWLGISSTGASGSMPASETAQVLSEIVVQCDVQVLNFIQKRSSLQKKIEEDLKTCSCLIKWPKEGKGEVILTFEGKEKKKPTKEWDNNCKEMMQKLLDEFNWKKVNVLQEIWNIVKSQMNAYVKKYKSPLEIDFDNDQCEIYFIGPKSEKEEFEKKLKEATDKLENELKRKNENISETITTIKTSALELMKTNADLIKTLKNKFPKLKFEIKQTELYLFGMTEEVRGAKLIFLEKANAIFNESMEVSEIRKKVLDNQGTKPYIMEQLHSASVSATWVCEERDVKVYSFDEKSLKKAIDILSSEIVEEHIQLDEAAIDLVKSNQWNDFIKNLCDDNRCLSMKIDGSTLVAAGTKNIMDDVKKRLEGFIHKHAIVTKSLDMDVGYMDLISRCLQDELKKIHKDLKECSGQLVHMTKDGDPGFTISGNQTAVEKAMKDLISLTERIQRRDQEYNIPGIPDYFYGKQGTKVLSDIQNKHKVSIQLDNSGDAGVSQNAGLSDAAGEIYRVEVSEGKFIILVNGDITRYPVDAIVNAANEDLHNMGGVAAAIEKAGGRELETDCIEQVKIRGRVLPGSACATRAGKLPCKKVIHTVGPRWINGHKEEHNILFQAIDSALNVAENERCESVAMPAISTGIFNFPLDKATDIIVDAVIDHLVGQSSHIREVYFIDNDQRVISSFEKKIKEIPNVLIVPPVDKRRGRPERQNDRNESSPEENRHEEQNTGSNSPFTSAGRGNVKTMEGVVIHLVKGSICDVTADIYVNTTGKELNLLHGNVSKSLLQVAGSAIQAEVDRNKTGNFDYGDIVVTKGFKLKCRYVYHGACRGWDYGAVGAGNCEQTVRKFMRNILNQAEKDGQKSVAIPAIGTGNLKIPHKFVADIMYDEVQKFSSTKTPRHIKEIHFVVYDKDLPSIKAFEEKIKELTTFPGSAANGRNVGAINMGNTNFSQQKPSGSSGAAFVFDSNTKTIRIGDIRMELKEGDITKEKADAIINSTDEKLNMTGGAVAKAILKAGGKVVEAECKRVQMTDKKICVTAGGDLPARYIIHLVAGNNPTSWKHVIVNSLEEAERLQFKDIVFPLLGTGQYNQSAELMANIMVDAVSTFCTNCKPVNLRIIKVCIFQSHMLREFVDAVVKKEKQSRGFLDRATDAAMGAFVSLANWMTIPKEANWDDNNEISDNVGPVGEGAASETKTRGIVSGVKRQNPIKQPHQSLIILSFYSLSDESFQKVLKEIEDIIKDYILDKVLESPEDQENIAKLNKEQIQRIKNLTDIFPVQVTVEKNAHMKRIRIRGVPNAVTSAVEQVYSIFHEAFKQEVKNREEEWIGRNVQWEYLDGNDYEVYPPDINAVIEKAFKNKNPFAEWEEENAKYRLTFQTMVEEFLNTQGTPPVKVRRVTSEMDLPANWDKMNLTDIYKTVLLNPTDQEYQDVENAARASAQASINQIIKIERIQSQTLFKQYFARKMAMDAANPKTQNEMTLWHGTTTDTLNSINATGFNRSYCGKNAVVYGRGVYFAKNFNYSAQNTYSPPDANGVKHIYQSKVLVGEYAVGNQQYIVPPSKPGNVNIKYDSVVDNATTPSVFVIFYDTQAYPEYLIYFK